MGHHWISFSSVISILDQPHLSAREVEPQELLGVSVVHKAFGKILPPPTQTQKVKLAAEFVLLFFSDLYGLEHRYPKRNLT